MSVVVNESKSGEKKLYTGVANCVVQAINPDKEELADLLNRESSEVDVPQYTGKSDEGIPWVRIDVWIRAANPDIPARAKMAFFISKEEFIGQSSGKKQFINLYGRCGWATTKEAIPEETKYYDDVDSRPAFRGEETFHKFLIAVTNAASPGGDRDPDPCRLDNPEKLFESDFSELHDIADAVMEKENEFRCLWGVKTTDSGNKYQDIFTGKFDRAYSRTVNIDNWNKALGLGTQYPWKSDYQDVLDVFQEYHDKGAVPPPQSAQGSKPAGQNTKDKAW